jgi:hypothetical protein
MTTDVLLLTVTLNERPILSSEREPHINKPTTVWS